MDYQIGDFSKITRLSIRALHHYQEYGLLEPAKVDEESGYRYYNEESLAKARLILELKELDFTLKEIKEIMVHYDNTAQFHEFLGRKSQEISDKIKIYRKIQARLERIMLNKEEITVLNKHEVVTLKDIPDQLVISLRFKGKYQDVGKAFGKLYKTCGNESAGAPFSLYYDREFRDEDADIEACVPVKKEINKDGIQSKVLPGGKAVTIVHHGPYESLGESYQVIFDYVGQQKLNIIGPSREIYLKGPGVILRGNPEKYLTEIELFIRE